MSASEPDFSEGSNMESPQSQIDSPYSSPSQQVPYLANAFSGITCDDLYRHADGKLLPHLRVLEQPQNYFRFRYKSEMVGTHGSLLGRSSSNNKTKTHPTVELVNYTGKAIIRCRLSQADKDEEHPHKLFEDEQEDRDVSAAVPEHGSYKVGFAGMGIIHTAKKDVPSLLFKKCMERCMLSSSKVKPKELQARCEEMAKSINLNIVRLRFSAHNVTTDAGICPPVFSEPIHNMKSAAVNDLKICRISRYYGRPRGGDDVFILVEKVNKKNIMIRFFEVDDQDQVVWSAPATFLLSDVHHQYAIVFRTPPYRDPHITKDVKVFMELVRPSDGRTSEPKEFIYKAEQVFRNNKRKRGNSSFSSLDSSSGGSIKSLSEIPTTVEMLSLYNERVDGLANVPVFQIPVPQAPATNEGSVLADALYYNNSNEPPLAPPGAPGSPLVPGGSPLVPGGSPLVTGGSPLGPGGSPLLSQPNAPEPPVISLNSTEFDRIINQDHAPSHEYRKFCEMDWSEFYIQHFSDSLSDSKTNSMEFLRAMQVVSDSGRAKGKSPKKAIKEEPKKLSPVDVAKSGEYNAYYKADDGNEVRTLVKEICELIKNKNGYKKQVVKNKLERVFELRLSNGDAFLHMALSSNQPSFEFIVKLVHSLKMTELLNLTNDLNQTILHLAVIYDMPKIVPLLLAKGCDPMIGDKEGNNAVHYAVMCQNCLHPLLATIKSQNIRFDLNASNFENQTALHLAALYDSSHSATLLLEQGASYNARDAQGRSPLHLAVYGDHLAVTQAILKHVCPSDIDAVDGCGNTALQIVCSTAMRPNSVKIAKLLLDKKADPQKHEDHNEAAWRVASHHPELKVLLQSYMKQTLHLEEDIKSEPEDEFESADEGDSTEGGLSELSAYVSELSSALDRGDAWRALATACQCHALESWFSHTDSPARTLLFHLKESGDMSSRALARCLQDIGQVEAANIIRKYVGTD